jgi:hypothetical protein
MKNQYFGDINDYRKYGLLRAFLSTGIGGLLVARMLTPDDGGQGGRFGDRAGGLPHRRIDPLTEHQVLLGADSRPAAGSRYLAPRSARCG